MNMPFISCITITLEYKLLEDLRDYDPEDAETRVRLRTSALSVVAESIPRATYVLRAAVFSASIGASPGACFLLALAAACREEFTLEAGVEWAHCIGIAFQECIRSPVQLLAVVNEFYALNGGRQKLPVVLRSCITKKFRNFTPADFETLPQSVISKPVRTVRELPAMKRRRVESGEAGLSECVLEEEENDELKGPGKGTCLRWLVRECHIAEPVEVVMAILGKKYPVDEAGFQRSGLPGYFDPSRAGQRVKFTRAQATTDVEMYGEPVWPDIDAPLMERIYEIQLLEYT
eukprot:TRINITY_DN82206_c0_g1_i1.p1 TRINITY_DN82206_c0_g1~~TRINITY_DN82206_c0_g1_i1.p1  ORF type:complete len:290 (-),score=46.26 TRINITY_DN82206_c0_g1_i1:40-909(-)